MNPPDDDRARRLPDEEQDASREGASSHRRDDATAEALRQRNENLRAAARAQLEEMEKYQWCLGVRLGRDPRLDRTVDEIRLEWISLYAEVFRKEWERRWTGREPGWC